ncbi:hypothetical protein VPH35_059403 [Triticum aestivum]
MPQPTTPAGGKRVFAGLAHVLPARRQRIHASFFLPCLCTARRCGSVHLQRFISCVCVCVCVCLCSPALVIYVAVIWSLSTMYGCTVRSSDVCGLASRVLQFRSPWPFGLCCSPGLAIFLFCSIVGLLCKTCKVCFVIVGKLNIVLLPNYVVRCKN